VHGAGQAAWPSTTRPDAAIIRAEISEARLFGRRLFCVYKIRQTACNVNKINARQYSTVADPPANSVRLNMKIRSETPRENIDVLIAVGQLPP
jgi:hypothetical protein